MSANTAYRPYDAEVLTDTRDVARYFEKLCSLTTYYKTASNWIMGPVKSYLNESGTEMADFPLSARVPWLN